MKRKDFKWLNYMMLSLPSSPFFPHKVTRQGLLTDVTVLSFGPGEGQ